MAQYQVLLGLLAFAIGLISYVPYFLHIHQGKTKPHPFSWIAWGLLSGIVFAAQVVKGGGAGSWSTGITAFVCFAIGIYAFSRGEKNITHSDWICFVASLLAIALWRLTSDPWGAVLIVTAADALAFAPTFRKAYRKPHEETLSTFSLSVPKWLLGIAALNEFTFTTVFFPATIALMNTAFVVLVLVRRRFSDTLPGDT